MCANCENGAKSIFLIPLKPPSDFLKYPRIHESRLSFTPAFFSFSFSHAEPPPRSVSGIHPSLAMFNQEGECGTGAVVPWAGRLWVITCGPHLPFGSSDKLYEITPELTQIIRPESIVGTPANRMLHKESNQLAIGP